VVICAEVGKVQRCSGHPRVILLALKIDEPNVRTGQSVLQALEVEAKLIGVPVGLCGVHLLQGVSEEASKAPTLDSDFD
jgi:hypothetical protein